MERVPPLLGIELGPFSRSRRSVAVPGQADDVKTLVAVATTLPSRDWGAP
jgi:hypothetical protein